MVTAPQPSTPASSSCDKHQSSLPRRSSHASLYSCCYDRHSQNGGRMLIVDSQVHIWGADTRERPWPKRAEPQRPIPLGHEDLLREMNEAGVDRVVIVPPSWEGDRNDLAIRAHLAHPDRFATMGRLDPQDPASRGKIAHWREQPGMLGLRFTFHIPQLVTLITEGHMDWVWGEAEDAGVPIYVLIPHPLVHLIDAVAAR